DIFMEQIHIGFEKMSSITINQYNEIIKDNISIGPESVIPCPLYQDSFLYKYIGHGGLEKYAPEMSLEAYELAAKFGMWGIESDVHLTKDDEIVMSHDETV